MSIHVVLNDPEVDRCCADLGIDRPEIRFIETPDELIYGRALEGPHIAEIRVGLKEQKVNSMRKVVSQLNRTLLHELKHFQQYRYTREMTVLDMEQDARQYEDDHNLSYKLIKRVGRKVNPIPGLKGI
jgi:hypothetical protein